MHLVGVLERTTLDTRRFLFQLPQSLTRWLHRASASPGGLSGQWNSSWPRRRESRSHRARSFRPRQSGLVNDYGNWNKKLRVIQMLMSTTTKLLDDEKLPRPSH